MQEEVHAGVIAVWLSFIMIAFALTLLLQIASTAYSPAALINPIDRA